MFWKNFKLSFAYFLNNNQMSKKALVNCFIDFALR